MSLGVRRQVSALTRRGMPRRVKAVTCYSTPKLLTLLWEDLRRVHLTMEVLMNSFLIFIFSVPFFTFAMTVSRCKRYTENNNSKCNVSVYPAWKLVWVENLT